MNNDIITLVKTQEELKPTITKLVEVQLTYDPHKDNAYLEEGTFLITKLANAKDQIEDIRVSFTKPLNESLKRINSFFKTFSEPIEEADRQLRKKFLEFRKEKEVERIEEQILAVENDLPEIPDLKKKIGGIVTKKVWTWELVDIKQIPDEYFELVPSRIRDSIRLGAREIPGIRVYQTDQISR